MDEHEEQYAMWVLEIDAFGIRNTPEKMQATEEAYCLVSCLSEAVLACSYNDLDILERLRNNSLDEEIRYMCDPVNNAYLNKQWFEYQMADHLQKDGQYQKKLMDVVRDAGGWPISSDLAVPISLRFFIGYDNDVENYLYRYKNWLQDAIGGAE